MKSTYSLTHTNRAMSFTIALTAVACAGAVGHFLEPRLGQAALYVFVFPAVVFSALCCGIGPSIASSLLAAAGLAYWAIVSVPIHGAVFAWRVLGVLAFLAACALIVALAEGHRRENES